MCRSFSLLLNTPVERACDVTEGAKPAYFATCQAAPGIDSQ